MSQPVTHAPRLDQKVALITGASNGLGRAIALAYASHGTKFIICADLQSASSSGETTATHEEINQTYGAGKADFIHCDVTKTDEVKNAVAFAVEKAGRLDIMVNNAGIGAPSIRLHEMPEEEWAKAMSINATGVFHGCKHALRQFLEQPPHHSGHRGWIVNLSSIYGLVGSPRSYGGYCASKAACMNLTRQVAVDYAQDKIHCNAICPGYLRTTMTQPDYEDAQVNQDIMTMTPWKEWGDVRDVARGAVVLASDDVNFVTGIAFPIDGGYTCR